MINNLRRFLFNTNKTERSAVISMVLRPLSFVLGLVYTPLLLNYLGNEDYGLWITILSVISWINYFDVGIGNGLRNVLTVLLAEKKNNNDNIKKVVSTSYIVLTVIACMILVILLILTVYINWGRVFSTTIDIRPSLIVSFFFICINFVLSLSNSLLYAMQCAEFVSLRNIYIQIINILGIIFLSIFTEGDLVYVSILFGVSTMIVYIYNTARIFKINTDFIPRFNYLCKDCINSVCNIGIKFFIIQVMGLAMFTIDNIIISHYFGPREVTPFSIVDKIFNTAYSVWAAFLVPYWSGTTMALSTGNIQWIKDSIKRILTFFSGFVAVFVLLALVFRPLTQFWLNQELSYQTGIIPIMCLFYILYSFLAIECQFINGTGKINVQLVSYILLGLANIPFSIFLGFYAGLGPLGVRLATTILVFIMVVILGFNLKSIISHAE